MTASWTPVDNALNPAWRETVVHLITSLSWDDSFSQEVKADMANDITYDKLSKLKQLDPDSGAYLNEVGHDLLPAKTKCGYLLCLGQCD